MAQKREKKRLAFFFPLFFLVQVSQAVSLSTMKPVTQPANKPSSSFHSAGPLARDQATPPNKEPLSCITSCQRGRAGCSFLSPGSASLQHKASTGPASLPPAPIISRHSTQPLSREGFHFRSTKKPRHVKIIRNKRFKAIKVILKSHFPKCCSVMLIKYGCFWYSTSFQGLSPKAGVIFLRKDRLNVIF